ncbi:hypothetical protein T492DRAFT_1152559, partial [Pavlovales sp. CCMP2436]
VKADGDEAARGGRGRDGRRGRRPAPEFRRRRRRCRALPPCVRGAREPSQGACADEETRSLEPVARDGAPQGRPPAHAPGGAVPGDAACQQGGVGAWVRIRVRGSSLHLSGSGFWSGLRGEAPQRESARSLSRSQPSHALCWREAGPRATTRTPRHAPITLAPSPGLFSDPTSVKYLEIRPS